MFVFNYVFHSFARLKEYAFNPLLRSNWVDFSFYFFYPYLFKERKSEWILLLIKICLLTFAPKWNVFLFVFYFHVSNVIYRLTRFRNKIYHILYRVDVNNPEWVASFFYAKLLLFLFFVLCQWQFIIFMLVFATGWLAGVMVPVNWCTTMTTAKIFFIFLKDKKSVSVSFLWFNCHIWLESRE